ncbi:MAG: 50S ribosomal protein L25 [Acidimicrobiales bacterium]
MAEITIAAQAPRPLGSSASRRLRAAGQVPAVLYGHGLDPLPVAVDGRALRAALTTSAGLNALLSLQVGKETHLALAREIQRDPVRSTVTHVDFQIVRRDEVVSAEVRIILVGEAQKVARGDGMLEHTLTALTVHATPSDIPPHVEVDVSQMEIGDTIRVGDLRLPKGVTAEVDLEEPVVVASRGVVVPVEEPEEAEEPGDGEPGRGEGTAAASGGGARAAGGRGGEGAASGG